MQRDKDIVRHLLMWVESDHSYQFPAELSREQLAYHTAILIDARLVEGTVHYSTRTRRGQRVPDGF